MTNSEVHVKAVGQNSIVLADKTVRTMANGFFELWLPRNENINLTIQGFDKTAIGVIDTFSRSKTCLTGFHLK